MKTLKRRPLSVHKKRGLRESIEKQDLTELGLSQEFCENWLVAAQGFDCRGDGYVKGNIWRQTFIRRDGEETTSFIDSIEWEDLYNQFEGENGEERATKNLVKELKSLDQRNASVDELIDIYEKLADDLMNRFDEFNEKLNSGLQQDGWKITDEFDCSYLIDPWYEDGAECETWFKTNQNGEKVYAMIKRLPIAFAIYDLFDLSKNDVDYGVRYAAPGADYGEEDYEGGFSLQNSIDESVRKIIDRLNKISKNATDIYNNVEEFNLWDDTGWEKPSDDPLEGWY